MKICVAQTRAVAGDIQVNITNHKKIIDLAVLQGADIIFFPELSLTGYEPKLSKQLATTQDDSRFDDFQKISDAKKVIIGVGMPTKNNSEILISMILFQPAANRQTYSKQYLHEDEYPYFSSGTKQVFLTANNTKIAPAICYESLVPEHSENAFKNGAEIYIASVAKSAAGVEKASRHLSNIARNYSKMVLMSNSLGPSDNFESAGKTSIWNRDGFLAGQLDDKNEGILLIDTDTQEIITKII